MKIQISKRQPQQLKLIDYVEDYIKKHNNNVDLIPANIGLSDASVTANTTQYNQL